MLTLQGISYQHANKEELFSNISITVHQHDKIALIGNNGVGKSILLKIIARELEPIRGQIKIDTTAYYVPQIFEPHHHLTVAQALHVNNKLHALHEILNGHATEENLTVLNDDWSIEHRCQEALSHWGLSDIPLTRKLATLSGGQKTKIFLAGIAIHQPSLILLDEPSNHLDSLARQDLYNFIESTASTLLVVSHDRKLLNLLNTVCELKKDGLTIYGGNYEFYSGQRETEIHALKQQIQASEKTLRKAKEKERETIERQQKLDSRGKRKQEKAGVARIMMNTLRNKAENSTAKVKSVHAEKINDLTQGLSALRSTLPDIDQMKFGFDDSVLHKGKVMVKITKLQFSYPHESLWPEGLTIQINSGERIAINGRNGSGKTTLIKLILGHLEPISGSVFRSISKAVYIDQDYTLIDNRLTVYEQALQFNTKTLQEHEVKIRLNRFLFTKEIWEKPCSVLSGGERMRLTICCLAIGQQSPDLVVLDEPTNNLDLQNIEILTAAIKEYRGTLLVVSHDETFLEQVNIGRTIEL